MCRITEENEALRFAKEELERYGQQVFTDWSTGDHSIDVGLSQKGETVVSEEIDEICIRVEGGVGRIVGSNPCAVLIAVYRFLRECGCRFLRPGADGEYLPRCLLSEVKVDLCERADMDVRCVVIEGACSYQNVYHMIDFCPKIGINHYQFQFKNSSVFFERWYDHEKNPYGKPEGLTEERVEQMIAALRAELKKRGMKLQTMGHGWTVFPIGLCINGWGVYSEPLGEETKSYLALVDGKRVLIDGKPFHTNLCYSNPAVVEKIADYMVKYCKENPQVDVVQFALADKWNVCCECADCASHRLSDLVIRMLNRVDERMTREGLRQRVGIAAYLDALWSPMEERLKNPDRFLLGFYPISRIYYESIPVDGIPDTEPVPYVRNQNKAPTACTENLAYLRAWQKQEPNSKKTVGEYHFMWDHYADFGYQKISRILWQDIRNYKKLGLSGMLSYQPQRCAVPTAMGLYTYGHTLWNNGVSFDALSEDYFRHAFGEVWEECYAYLNTLSKAWDMKLRRDCDLRELKDGLEACRRIVRALRPHLSTMPTPTLGLHAVSLQDLRVYSEYLEKWMDTLLLLLNGEAQASGAAFDSLMDFLWQIEDAVQERWDVYNLASRLKRWYRGLAEKIANTKA